MPLYGFSGIWMLTQTKIDRELVIEQLQRKK